jgi:hypothetical protein
MFRETRIRVRPLHVLTLFTPLLLVACSQDDPAGKNSSAAGTDSTPTPTTGDTGTGVGPAAAPIASPPNSPPGAGGTPPAVVDPVVTPTGSASGSGTCGPTGATGATGAIGAPPLVGGPSGGPCPPASTPATSDPEPGGGGTPPVGGGGTPGGGGETAGGGGNPSPASMGGGGAAGSSIGGAAPVGGNAGTGEGGAPPVAEECIVPETGPVSEVITFNDDGGWCWYQDERVIVDPDQNRMVIASVATGGNRNGNIEVSFYDLEAGGAPERNMLGDLNPDDHNVAALTKLGPDSYLAVYTTHNDDCYSYYNVYSNGSWSQQSRFDWASYGCPTPSMKTVSYSNLWHMGDEVYNFVRSVETSPNLMISTDGSSWEYGGRLSSTPQVGYVAGYYKYWGNNTDRIDFVGTEAHPRDNDNSLYHGYVKDGKSHNSTGEVIDEDIHDGSAPDITEFTPVFRTGSNLGSTRLIHMWNHDLMRYEDGTIVLLFQGRANDNTDDPDKRFGYARFDGTEWKSTYLVRGGSKLYDSEQDYTGLGAVHPNDPFTIYVSTTTDPRDDSTSFSKHEIWRGTTCDGGTSFAWTPITENSTEDNLRPVVPDWDSEKTALLWMRGSYNSAQTYDTAIVGVILDGR